VESATTLNLFWQFSRQAQITQYFFSVSMIDSPQLGIADALELLLYLDGNFKSSKLKN
jgi:hypothetical protein